MEPTPARICLRCQEAKPLDAFARRSPKKRWPYCGPCVAELEAENDEPGATTEEPRPTAAPSHPGPR